MADIIRQDALFRYLVKFSIVENFYKRALRRSVRDGEENYGLVAPMIIRDLPSVRDHVRQRLSFRPIAELNLRKTFLDERHKDGAYVMDKRTISNKIYLQNLVQSVLRDTQVQTVENLHSLFLPDDFMEHHAKKPSEDLIGTKTQNALCAGLRGGRGYLVKQTAYGATGMGKICVFDGTGLRAEFFLAREYRTLYPSSTYFHPLKRIVGYVREYGMDKKARTEELVTPDSLGIGVNKYLDLQTKFVTNVGDWFKFVQLGA